MHLSNRAKSKPCPKIADVFLEFSLSVSNSGMCHMQGHTGSSEARVPLASSTRFHCFGHKKNKLKAFVELSKEILCSLLDFIDMS